MLVCSEKDIREKERQKVEKIRNLELLFNERVHAKCYYNEESMVITSLNLYESRDGDNREMGIFLSKFAEEDKVAFRDAVAEAEFIIRESTPAIGTVSPSNPEPLKVRSTSHSYRAKPSTGFCIRCKRPIGLNPDAPYCPDCSRVWALYKNPDYEEKVCHICGQPANTSRGEPRCPDCRTVLT